MDPSLKRKCLLDGVDAHNTDKAGETSGATSVDAPKLFDFLPQFDTRPSFPETGPSSSNYDTDGTVFTDDDDSNENDGYVTEEDSAEEDSDEEGFDDDLENSRSVVLTLNVLWTMLKSIHEKFVHDFSDRQYFDEPLDTALERVKTEVHIKKLPGIALGELDLYNRLMTELRKLETTGAESAPDYMQQGVSGLWKGFGSRGPYGYYILIEDSDGNVLGLGEPHDLADPNCVFFGRKSGIMVYKFKIRHEDLEGKLAGKGVMFWYDQDLKCMNKWPRHTWYRIPNAKPDFLETGLLNPRNEWKQIGTGGEQRIVYEAVAFDGSEVAVKVIRMKKVVPIVDGKKDVSERKFQEREAHLLYSLDCKYIIPCYTTFQVETDDGTLLHLVMERAIGTLEDYISQLDRENLYQSAKKLEKRYLAENEIWQIFLEVLLGLNFLHTNEQRILHRDISMCNILRVQQKGKEGNPDSFIHKLADLGVARVRRPQTESTLAGTTGKERNFAPEHHQWRGNYTEKTDVFQLGLIGHYCCFLKLPYEGQLGIKNYNRRTIEQINSKYSADLDEVIHSCLHLSPDSRPSTLELLANPKVRQKGKELGLDFPDPISIVGLIKVDFDKPEIAVFNKGKLLLEYPPRLFFPEVVRKGLYPPVSINCVIFGSSSYVFHSTKLSTMTIRFKCVRVCKPHDWNLQLTLRHLSSIVGYNEIDGCWHSPINIYLNGEIVSKDFLPIYWMDYAEDIFKLPSDRVLWNGTVNVLQIQLAESATTNYWLQGCNLQIQRRMLDVEDCNDGTHQDVTSEIIWVLTRVNLHQDQ